MSCGYTEMYPEDWKNIAHRVKNLSGWKCAKCGRPHDPEDFYVLTVHHIDGDTNNNEDDNLVALCQRCHLAMQHKSTAVRHGQVSLF